MPAKRPLQQPYCEELKPSMMDRVSLELLVPEMLETWQDECGEMVV